jgi:peroxiredoxin
MRIRAFVLGLLVAIFAFPLAGCSTASREAAEVGASAPEFTLPTREGTELSLSQLRGKPVLLNFWATWCQPCREEMPYIQAVYEEVGEDLFILAVNIQETKPSVEEFLQQGGFTFPVALDHQGDVARNYGIRFIPTTFLIDREGIIREVKAGAFKDKAEILAGLERVR